MRHIIDFEDVTMEQWRGLYKSFEDIIARPGDYSDACRGKTMASLFYEPSTRTSFSFQSAMLRLGGGVFGFADPKLSSAAKGETLKDTIVMVSGYSDAVVIRHPREGASLAASLYSSRPVINAGDGGHFHPTQTMTDLATITKRRGGIDGLRIGLCGDLKNGRTVHSLLRALGRFKGVQVYLISPRELAVPQYLREHMTKAGMSFIEVTGLEATLGQLDALYMTRIQRERFADPLEYERLKGVYVLTSQKLKTAKRDLMVLHPLPRVDEINQDVDSDPRAAYFEQARYGMYIRMALLLRLTSLDELRPDLSRFDAARRCSNPGCITASEGYLPVLESGGLCVYCDHGID